MQPGSADGGLSEGESDRFRGGRRTVHAERDLAVLLGRRVADDDRRAACVRGDLERHRPQDEPSDASSAAGADHEHQRVLGPVDEQLGGLPADLLPCDVQAGGALARPVGEEMGRVLASLHERHGTSLRVGVGVEALEGDGQVQAVRLADGTTIEADLVVVGIGVSPNTAWLEGSGLTLGDGVECDETLCAGVDGVYAAGDLASWINPTFERRMRLEHWTIAAEQGGVAGKHASDPAAATPYETVPYFWSDWYGKRIQFVGVAADAEEIVTVVGDVEGDTFITLYRRGDRLVGALALEARSQIMKYRAMLAKRASWDEAMTYAEERAAKAAAAAAVAANGP